MNIIEEIFKSYERNKFIVEQKELFFEESQEILDKHIEDKVKSLLHEVNRSKPSISYDNLGLGYAKLLKETGERVFYKGKDITDEILQSTEDKPFVIP